ncbi:MAG: hypothetical protein M3Y51_07685 [Actinomycetota bacterium]|nr:hypothetical protein [Actinomycetota bacterium]
MGNSWVGGRPTRRRVATVAAAMVVMSAALGSAFAAADQPAPPVSNPGLDVACGIKVAVVLDESGSIGGYFGPTDPSRADFTPQVRDAFRKLVGALAGTNSTMFVTEFADNGNTAISPTPIDGNEQVFESYITFDYNPRLRGLTGEYHTNWEAGLEEVRMAAQTGAFVPDLVIMLTDGEANKRYQWPGAAFVPEVAEDRGGANGLLSQVATAPAVDEAVDEANYLKGRGTRLFGVGVNLQSEGTFSMARVAGATEWDGDPATLASSDYVTYSDAAMLDNALALIGTQACSTGVTVNKFEQRGERRTPGSGWDFTVTPAEVPVRWLVPTTGAPSSRTLRTTDDGRAAFTWVTRRVTSGITVVEAQRPGWGLGPVDCMVTAKDGTRSPIAHTLVPGGFRLSDVDVGAKVSCDVVNVEGGTPVTVPPGSVPTTTVPGTATTVPGGSTTTVPADAEEPADPDDESPEDEQAGPTTEVAGRSKTAMRPVEVLSAAVAPGLALTGAELPLPLAGCLLLLGAAFVVLGRRTRRR